MEWYDFIKIQGLNTTPSGDVDGSMYEVFQGISGTSVTGTDTGTDTGTAFDAAELVSQLQAIAEAIRELVSGGDFEEKSFSAALWAAQTTAIQGESSYLRQLDLLYKKKFTLLTTEQSQVLDFFTESIGNAIGASAGGLAVTYGAVAAAPWVATVTKFVSEVGVGMVFDRLEGMLTDGNKLIAAMIGENSAVENLPVLEHTFNNYRIRQDIQARHSQQIEMIVDQVSRAESDLREALNINNVPELLELLCVDIRKSFLTPLRQSDGSLLLDAKGQPMNVGFLEQRLKDLAYVSTKTDMGNFMAYTDGKVVEF